MAKNADCMVVKSLFHNGANHSVLVRDAYPGSVIDATKSILAKLGLPIEGIVSATIFSAEGKKTVQVF